MLVALPKLSQVYLLIMDNGVKLRPMEGRDLRRVRRWRNDLRVREHMFNASPIDEIEHAAWFKTSSLNERRYLLVVLRADILFGFAQFNLSQCRTVADWGFYVDPDGPKGQGYELGHSVLSFAFNSLQLKRVNGKVLDSNIRSIKFHRRMGFVEEGRLRSHHLTELGYQDVHLFGLLAHEWKR